MLKKLQTLFQKEKFKLWFIFHNPFGESNVLFLHMGGKRPSKILSADPDGMIGEIHIMIFKSDWFLEDADENEILSHEETDENVYKAAFSPLIGAYIVSIDEPDPSEQVIFTFNNGYKLLVFEATELYGENEVMFYISRKGEKAICYSPAKRFYEAD